MDDIINAAELTTESDNSLRGFLARVQDTLKASPRIFRDLQIATAVSKSLKGMHKFPE